MKVPAGAAADHDGVDLPAQLVVEFAAGGLVVKVGIVLIFELAGDEGVGSAGSAFFDVVDGGLHTVGSRGVRITSAPSASISVTFSCEKPSGTARTVL